MSEPADIWADVVLDVVRELDDLLAAIPPDGWETLAANVTWTCWTTADHISGDFAHYAAQVIGGPRDHYVKFSFDTSRAKTPTELREVVSVAGGLLASAVRTANPTSLAWHPHGFFTPRGFAAIGAAEALVHGHDIAAGLGIPWSPEATLCERVLHSVFPDAQRAGSSALDTLLSETGRTDTPGRAWTYAAASGTGQR